jgi:hypothetical protein
MEPWIDGQKICLLNDLKEMKEILPVHEAMVLMYIKYRESGNVLL